MKTAILSGLFLVVATAIWANPILVEEDDDGPYTTFLSRKTAEEVIAVVRESDTFVSCQVTFRLRPAKTAVPSKRLFLALPVFIDAGANQSDEQLTTTFSPFVQFGEGRYHPEATLTRGSRRRGPQYYPTPDGTEIVWFRFLLPVDVGTRDVSVVVSYVQPAIAGRFMYLPLLEDGLKDSMFFMSVIGSTPSDSLVTSDGKMASRHRIPLRHNQIIEVRKADANQALQTTPMTRSVYGKTTEFGHSQRGV